MTELWPWLALAGLGAFHGLNPAMGWLFAVALGLQERSWRAVLAALPPIALGHAASVGLMVLLMAVLGLVLPLSTLRLLGAALLIGFGLYRLARRFAHPRWVGMRVGFRDLTLWSFLMATAHGAGLILAPVLIHTPVVDGHAAHLAALIEGGGLAMNRALAGLAVVAVHTLAMLLVTAIVALVVYDRLGLAILRRAWLNLDVLWVGAIFAAAALTLVI